MVHVLTVLGAVGFPAQTAAMPGVSVRVCLGRSTMTTSFSFDSRAAKLCGVYSTDCFCALSPVQPLVMSYVAFSRFSQMVRHAELITVQFDSGISGGAILSMRLSRDRRCC